MNTIDQQLLSVIVPVYNVDEYIKKCVNSILAQTYRNLEIILVDDGSTDQSGIICDSFLKVDNRVRVIHQSNGGLSAARNTGMALARGEWIGFVDGDDWIEPSMYAEMLQSIEDSHPKADLVICGYRTVSESGDTIKTVSPKEKENITGEEAIRRLYSEQDVLYISACVRLYSKRILKNIRFPEGKKFEDEYIAHGLLYSCNSINIIAGPLYVYLQRKNSITHACYDIRMLDQIEAYYQRYCFIKQHKIKELVPISCERFSDFYIESKKQFHPQNIVAKERVQNLDRLAKSIIHAEWRNLPLKVNARLLVPSLYTMISIVKKKRLMGRPRSSIKENTQ